MVSKTKAQLKSESIAKLQMMEDLLTPLIKSDPRIFVNSLNNVCSHGDIFVEAGLTLDENDLFLEAWFEGIHKLKTAIRRNQSEFYFEYERLVWVLSRELHVVVPDYPVPSYSVTEETDKKYLKQLSDLIKSTKKQKEKMRKESLKKTISNK